VVHRGTCLCGAVEYAFDGEPLALANCHCSLCRKSHGAAFVTHAVVPAPAFRIVRGAEALSRYASSPGYLRAFCTTCGSRLFEETPRGIVAVAAGSLDSVPAEGPRLHFFVASKAPWFTITDDLPRFPAEPGDG
jgi:hypothetical protein